MKWNYRVIEFLDPDTGPWRAIHAVYYDAAGRPVRYAEQPATVISEHEVGESASIEWVLKQMHKAVGKRVLAENDFRQSSEPESAARSNSAQPRSIWSNLAAMAKIGNLRSGGFRSANLASVEFK